MLVSSKHRKLVLPLMPHVANMSPHAKVVTYQGNKVLALPHDHDHVRLLRNVGVAAPAPILHHYDWPGPEPFDVQRWTAAALTCNRRFFVLNDIGTGKTRAALYAADFLMREGIIRRALVAAPLSTLTSVWEDEIFRVFPGRTAVSLHGNKSRRVRLLDTDADFYIINHDGVKVIQKELLARSGLDLLIIDELSTYRNSRSQRWKALRPLAAQVKYAWGMTGAPTPNGPTDAYGQVRMLVPTNLDTSFRYFQQRVMRQVSTFRWIPKPDAVEHVRSIMQPAVRYSRDQCLDLPPKMIVPRAVDMSPLQAQAYKQMHEALRVQYQDGKIVAANEGVKLGKLLQICCGFIYTQDGRVLDLKAKGRQQALLDLIEDTDQKVIVFVPFVHAVHSIFQLVKKHHPASLVYGGVPKAERDKIFTTFQHSTNPRILVAHPGCMSHGLTLTKSNTIIWYSPTQSLDTYIQACGRITRAGQRNKQYIAHVISGAVERRVYSRLAKQESMQGILLSLFEGGTNGKS